MAAIRDDIELDGTPFTVYTPLRGLPGTSETHVPELATDQPDYQTEPLPLDTFHLGAFYSWRLIGGTYAYGDNVDCRHPRLVMPGPAMNSVTLTGSTDHARAARDYNGDLYIGAGRYVYKIAGGIGAVTQDLDVGLGNVAWSMEPFLGNLYVGTAAGSTSTSLPGLLRQKSAGAWDPGTSGINRKHLTQVFYNTDYRLIGTDGISTIAHAAAAPLVAGSWATGIAIGEGANSGYGINKLIATNQHVYIAKTNGLYDVDGTTGHSPNITPAFSYVVDDENGIAGHTMGGAIYTGHLKGLFRLQVSGSDAGRQVVVTPGYGLPNETPIRGKQTASIAEGGWQVVAIYNGTDTYICYGRDIRQGDAGTSPFGYGVGYGPSPSALGPSPMLWHGGLIKLAGQKCYLLHVSGLTSPPRLWVGAGPNGGPYNVQWCVLPRTDNPMQDPEYRFASAYSLYIPGQDWGHVATRKDLLQIDVEGDNLGVGAALAINVNVEGGPYSLFGTASVSPQSQVVGLADYIGRRIGFRLDGSSTGTSAPILRSFMPRADIRIATRRIKPYELILSEGNIDRFGGRSISSPVKDYEKLLSLQGGGRVTLRDEFQDTYQVLVEPPVERKTLALRPESGKGTEEPVLVASVRLKVVSGPNSSNAFGKWGSFSWGDGTVYS